MMMMTTMMILEMMLMLKMTDVDLPTVCYVIEIMCKLLSS